MTGFNGWPNRATCDAFMTLKDDSELIGRIEDMVVDALPKAPVEGSERKILAVLRGAFEDVVDRAALAAERRWEELKRLEIASMTPSEAYEQGLNDGCEDVFFHDIAEAIAGDVRFCIAECGGVSCAALDDDAAAGAIGLTLGRKALHRNGSWRIGSGAKAETVEINRYTVFDVSSCESEAD